MKTASNEAKGLYLVFGTSDNKNSGTTLTPELNEWRRVVFIPQRMLATQAYHELRPASAHVLSPAIDFSVVA